MKEESMIQEIIDNFDFGKCQEVMEMTNWVWISVGIPTVNHLIDSARQRLRNAINSCKDKEISHKTVYHVSSGGLKASAIKNRYGHIIWISLEFVLTDWSLDYDFDE
jgi:hypothetical protein